jgi:predicted nucleic-acid-binding Zn-ribbon protein
MPENSKCIKCDGRMEIGFLRDHAGRGSVPVQWIAGVPEQGWRGAKIHYKTRYVVHVLRCSKCGYLEHYARQQLPVAGQWDAVIAQED